MTTPVTPKVTPSWLAAAGRQQRTKVTDVIVCDCYVTSGDPFWEMLRIVPRGYMRLGVWIVDPPESSLSPHPFMVLSL